eukprot:3658220-Rhodomonas_salina.1
MLEADSVSAPKSAVSVQKKSKAAAAPAFVFQDFAQTPVRLVPATPTSSIWKRTATEPEHFNKNQGPLARVTLRQAQGRPKPVHVSSRSLDSTAREREKEALIPQRRAE